MRLSAVPHPVPTASEALPFGVLNGLSFTALRALISCTSETHPFFVNCGAGLQQPQGLYRECPEFIFGQPLSLMLCRGSAGNQLLHGKHILFQRLIGESCAVSPLVSPPFRLYAVQLWFDCIIPQVSKNVKRFCESFIYFYYKTKCIQKITGNWRNCA